MPGRLSGSSIHLFYILRHKVFSDCMGISVEVEDYAWIRRIVEKENLARLSSDCVVYIEYKPQCILIIPINVCVSMILNILLIVCN